MALGKRKKSVPRRRSRSKKAKRKVAFARRVRAIAKSEAMRQVDTQYKELISSNVNQFATLHGIFDTTANAIDNANTSDAMFAEITRIPPGDDFDDRTGSSIRLISLQLRFYLVNACSGAWNQRSHIRIMVFSLKDPPVRGGGLRTASSVKTELFGTNSPSVLQLPLVGKLKKLYYDRLWHVTPRVAWTHPTNMADTTTSNPWALNHANDTSVVGGARLVNMRVRFHGLKVMYDDLSSSYWEAANPVFMLLYSDDASAPNPGIGHGINLEPSGRIYWKG